MPGAPPPGPARPRAPSEPLWLHVHAADTNYACASGWTLAGKEVAKYLATPPNACREACVFTPACRFYQSDWATSTCILKTAPLLGKDGERAPPCPCRAVAGQRTCLWPVGESAVVAGTAAECRTGRPPSASPRPAPRRAGETRQGGLSVNTCGVDVGAASIVRSLDDDSICQGVPGMCNVPVSKAVIAGTHNSASYNIPPSPKDLLKFRPFNTSTTRTVTQSLGAVQGDAAACSIGGWHLACHQARGPPPAPTPRARAAMAAAHPHPFPSKTHHLLPPAACRAGVEPEGRPQNPAG